MSAPQSSGQKPTTMKQTLTLTALLVNAMALIAPGAFLWTTFQMNAAQSNNGASTASARTGRFFCREN